MVISTHVSISSLDSKTCLECGEFILNFPFLDIFMFEHNAGEAMFRVSSKVLNVLSPD